MSKTRPLLAEARECPRRLIPACSSSNKTRTEESHAPGQTAAGITHRNDVTAAAEPDLGMAGAAAAARNASEYHFDHILQVASDGSAFYAVACSACRKIARNSRNCFASAAIIIRRNCLAGRVLVSGVWIDNDPRSRLCAPFARHGGL